MLRPPQGRPGFTEEAPCCLLHVNALFVDPAKAAPRWPPDTGARGLNHPNFHYGADAALLARLGRHGATFVEVANEAVDSNNAGDAQHPSTEALWDAVLSQGVRLWGTATDDAHPFYDAAKARAAGEEVFVGDSVRARHRHRPPRRRGPVLSAILHATRAVGAPPEEATHAHPNDG